MPVSADNPPAERAWSGLFYGVRGYLGLMFAGNLIWEILHLPLYTLWTTASARYQAFAVIHCTFGDLLIAFAALVAALLIAGNAKWPRRQFLPVAAFAIAFGIGYTVFSEWLNVTVRASWAYSEWMPVVPLFGLKVGLSPLLQWLVIPTAAFALTARLRDRKLSAAAG